MNPNPYPFLQSMAPINESEFDTLRNVRPLLDSLSRWAIIECFGSAERAVPPAAQALDESIDLRGLTSAVRLMNATPGLQQGVAVACIASQVSHASERLSAGAELTAEQRSDIDQLWQAIVQTDRFAQQRAAMK